MEGLALTLLAILGLSVALLTAFGVLAPDSSMVFKLVLAIFGGVLGVGLLGWRIIVVSYNRWGLKLEVDESMSEIELDGTRHAVAVLKTRWPHLGVSELRIRLTTFDQSEMDTSLMSKDGRYEYDEYGGTCHLTHSAYAGLVPLACWYIGYTNACLGIRGRDGQTIHRNGSEQSIEVGIMRGHHELVRRQFVVSAVDGRLKVRLP
jgi:hypothetical protein